MHTFRTVSALAHTTMNHASFQLTNVIAHVYNAHIVAGAIARFAPPLCTASTDPFVSKIATGVTAIVGILTGVGVAAAVIGIIIGGFMRATSFGNERKVAMSNTAITCAVVGLVIVLVSVTLGDSVPGWFGLANACGI